VSPSSQVVEHWPSRHTPRAPAMPSQRTPQPPQWDGLFERSTQLSLQRVNESSHRGTQRPSRNSPRSSRLRDNARNGRGYVRARHTGHRRSSRPPSTRSAQLARWTRLQDGSDESAMSHVYPSTQRPSPSQASPFRSRLMSLAQAPTSPWAVTNSSRASAGPRENAPNEAYRLAHAGSSWTSPAHRVAQGCAQAHLDRD
jgi:hypothetical protein